MEVSRGGASMIAIAISDASQVGEARRAALALAPEDEALRGRLALVVAELATNVLKHAQRGEIVVRAIARGGSQGVEVVSIDGGPGIPDVERAMSDGFSTAGTSGAGLGAIRRMADELDLYTQHASGTVVMARLWTQPAPARGDAIDIGVVRVAKSGETLCGDDWSARDSGSGRVRVVVADGLGHGPAAAEASQLATEVGAAQPEGRSPSESLGAIHAALRPTRGAAVALAELDPGGRCVVFAGVGNIAGGIFASDSRSFMSHNGTAGHAARHIQEFSYPWPSGSLMILHSDGVSARWDWARYVGLAGRDPSVIAGVLYRDHTRRRDDAIVLVARAAS